MVSAYREAELRDLPAVCALGQVVNLLHYEAWPSIFAPPSEPLRDESHWRQSIGQPNATTFVAEHSVDLIAFVTVMLAEESNPLLQSMCYTRIGSVCVAKPFRGKGVGKQLMSLAEQWGASRGAKDMRLNVWSFNESALAFYQELGYQVRSVLMGKPLS
jgi:GNAT superfamily N-acetyltransferase